MLSAALLRISGMQTLRNLYGIAAGILTVHAKELYRTQRQPQSLRRLVTPCAWLVASDDALEGLVEIPGCGVLGGIRNRAADALLVQGSAEIGPLQALPGHQIGERDALLDGRVSEKPLASRSAW